MVLLRPGSISNREHRELSRIQGGPQEVVIEKDLSGKAGGTRKVSMRRKLVT